MVLGINPGSMKSHQKFCNRLGLSFPLLVDADRSVSRAYGVLKASWMMISRTVVIVDREGIVRYVKRGMPADSELLESIGNP